VPLVAWACARARSCAAWTLTLRPLDSGAAGSATGSARGASCVPPSQALSFQPLTSRPPWRNPGGRQLLAATSPTGTASRALRRASSSRASRSTTSHLPASTAPFNAPASASSTASAPSAPGAQFDPCVPFCALPTPRAAGKCGVHRAQKVAGVGPSAFGVFAVFSRDSRICLRVRTPVRDRILPRVEELLKRRRTRGSSFVRT